MSESGEAAPAWFCEAHRVWMTSDCPKCDDELEKWAGYRCDCGEWIDGQAHDCWMFEETR